MTIVTTVTIDKNKNTILTLLRRKTKIKYKRLNSNKFINIIFKF